MDSNGMRAGHVPQWSYAREREVCSCGLELPCPVKRLLAELDVVAGEECPDEVAGRVMSKARRTMPGRESVLRGVRPCPCTDAAVLLPCGGSVDEP